MHYYYMYSEVKTQKPLFLLSIFQLQSERFVKIKFVKNYFLFCFKVILYFSENLFYYQEIFLIRGEPYLSRPWNVLITCYLLLYFKKFIKYYIYYF